MNRRHLLGLRLRPPERRATWALLRPTTKGDVSDVDLAVLYHSLKLIQKEMPQSRSGRSLVKSKLPLDLPSWCFATRCTTEKLNARLTRKSEDPQRVFAWWKGGWILVVNMESIYELLGSNFGELAASVGGRRQACPS